MLKFSLIFTRYFLKFSYKAGGLVKFLLKFWFFNKYLLISGWEAGGSAQIFIK